MESWERIEKVNNAELKSLIVELKAIDTGIATMVEESEKARQKFDSELMVRQKIVDKMKPIVEDLFEGQLEEFEVLANVTCDGVSTEDEVDVKIINEVEKFKSDKRKAKEKTFAKPEGETIEEKVA